MATEQETNGSALAAPGGLADLLSNSGPLANIGELLAGARREFESAPREGVSGGGLVRVTLAGDGRLTAVNIDPGLFAAAAAGDLEDMILAAFSNAFEALQQEKQQRLFALTGVGSPSAAP